MVEAKISGSNKRNIQYEDASADVSLVRSEKFL